MIQVVVLELVRRGYLNQPQLNGGPVVPIAIVLGLLPFLFDLIVLICLFGKTRITCLVAALCCGAFASRMVLAFSPTLFASNTRTFIFLDFGLILALALLLVRFKFKRYQAVVLFAGIIWFTSLAVQSAVAYVLAV